MIGELGCRVLLTTAWRGEPCDVMVALHARRSHPSLVGFRSTHPQRAAVLALTGTDLYRDIHVSPQAQEALESATRLLVLQDAALDELTPAQRMRARVIYQSAEARYAHRPPEHLFRAVVLGHLREEKDPFRAALALRHLPGGPDMCVVHAGKPLSPEFEKQAEELMRGEPRYRWVGELPHWRALKLLAASHVMVISSRIEGGAHVVSEAVVHGVPVIASDIAGNRGMLGEDYPGYFPLEDEHALAQLLSRARSDNDFLGTLRSRVLERQPLFAPQREQEAWKRLLEELQ
jgi:putative glycosyltransferase (TIGR04348 family)